MQSHQQVYVDEERLVRAQVVNMDHLHEIRETLKQLNDFSR